MIIKTTAVLISGLAAGLALGADNPSELQRIRSLQDALTMHGVTGLLSVAKGNAWLAPVIPSKWHVAHVAKTNEIPADEAARQFGGLLVAQLAEMDKSVLAAAPDEALHSRIVTLFALADWVAASEGYGNLLLAQKCTDLAALGLTRLATNVEFPMKSIKGLSPRLDPAWMSAATRVRVLNADAGADMFSGTQTEDIQNTWASGCVLLSQDRSSRQKDEPDWSSGRRKLIEMPILRSNKAFFQDDEMSKTGITLMTMWDHKCHERLVTGLELQSIEEAKALIEFRERMGRFPVEDNPISPYRGVKGAFDEAWRSTVVKTPTMSHLEWNRELGKGLLAWRVYDKVKGNKLLPAL